MNTERMDVIMKDTFGYILFYLLSLSLSVFSSLLFFSFFSSSPFHAFPIFIFYLHFLPHVRSAFPLHQSFIYSFSHTFFCHFLPIISANLFSFPYFSPFYVIPTFIPSLSLLSLFFFIHPPFIPSLADIKS